jgi:hypothetical protein
MLIDVCKYPESANRIHEILQLFRIANAVIRNVFVERRRYDTGTAVECEVDSCMVLVDCKLSYSITAIIRVVHCDQEKAVVTGEQGVLDTSGPT